LANNLVTSHYVSGAVRLSLSWRLYRRYEEWTQWESFVVKHFPEVIIPKQKKARNKFRREVESTLLADPEFCALHDTFSTKITLAVQLLEEAIAQGVPFETVLFDAWYLAPELIAVLEANGKKWISLLTLNRKIETNNLVIRDEAGETIKFDKPQIQVQKLIPLISKLSRQSKHSFCTPTSYWVRLITSDRCSTYCLPSKLIRCLVNIMSN
jgi:hypothetical protein